MRNKERAARDVSLSQLRTFIRIVERGSLTAAALDLATTQPTVSRHLRELEEAYQVALAIRTTRSLRLTDEGRAVYEQAKQIAQAEDELRDRLHGSLGSLEGRIQVTAPSGFGAFVVAPFCCRFIERHPGIGIDLSLTDRHVDLVGEGVDIAVRIGQLPDSSLFATRLANLEEIVVVHQRHLTQVVAKPIDLCKLPWIGLSGPTVSQVIHLHRKGQSQIIPITPRMLIDQVVGYREALIAGAGAGVIHRYAVDAEIQAGRLVQLLPEWRLQSWPLHIVSPIRHLSLRARTWCMELAQEIATVPGLTSV